MVVCVGRDEAEFRRRAVASGQDPDQARAGAAAGTPAEVVDRIAEFEREGAETVYLQYHTLDEPDHLELIGTEVLAAARARVVSVRFGVHTGLQHTSIDELQPLWRRIEALGFDWISIWDHFYAADATGDPHSLEAITAHAALAATTERVTCGSLVYSAGYRHPAVLANAMATLDQIAHGRTVLGLGGGWLRGEYRAYGLRYGTPGERLRMLEEYVQCVRGLLTRTRGRTSTASSSTSTTRSANPSPCRSGCRSGSAAAARR